MTPQADRDRLERVRRVLRRDGMSGWTARAEGPRGEVLVLTGPAAASEPTYARAARLVDEMRAIGFQHVALDLAEPDGAG